MDCFKIVFITYCETLNAVYHQAAYTVNQVKSMIEHAKDFEMADAHFVELPDNYFGGKNA